MEPINQQNNSYVDYRNTPVRFPRCMGVIKQRLGYESDQEIPWIFRNIPGAKEKCLSIEIDNANGITIKFLKYKHKRDAIFIRMQQGKLVEGYFESNNFTSARGFFFNAQLYQEFIQIQQETITFPQNMSPMNVKIQALSLLCDGDNFLIPRELYTGRIQVDLNLCFLSQISMNYLMLSKNFRFLNFFDELLRHFTGTVFHSREAVFHFARMQHSGERKLAYVVFSDSLYLMNFFYDSFMSSLPLEECLRNEDEEIESLPRISEVSSITDFSIDIDFNVYRLVETNGEPLAVLNMENFLDELEEEPRVENLIFDPFPRNSTYEDCDVFLFKSAWRYFADDERIPDECIICFKKFKDSDLLKRFACQRHVFHMACINKWVDEHDTCPLCKYKLSDGLAEDKDAKLLRKKRNNH